MLIRLGAVFDEATKGEIPTQCHYRETVAQRISAESSHRRCPKPSSQTITYTYSWKIIFFFSFFSFLLVLFFSNYASSRRLLNYGKQSRWLLIFFFSFHSPSISLFFFLFTCITTKIPAPMCAFEPSHGKHVRRGHCRSLKKKECVS